MIGNIVGPPARGNDFYNREELLAHLWNRLARGNNLLLVAPRRFGKTSVMHRLIDDLKPSWKPVHVDAESIRAPVNFIIALLDALTADQRIRKFLVSSWQRTCGWTRGLFEDVEITSPWDVGLKLRLKDRIGAHWEERGEALLHVLRGFDGKQKLLIIIDELPVMLYLFRDNNVSEGEIKTFLYWFRKLRTDPKVGLTNCRFLVGGSIGIEHYLSELAAQDSFNDFERVAVREFLLDRASDFLQKLLASEGIHLSPSARRTILALIGTPIPYFIQVFVAEIAAEKASGVTKIGPKRLEQIHQHRILGPECKSYFQHYYDRLRRYDKPQELAAKELLKALALAQPAVIPAAQLRAIYRRALGEAATDDRFALLLGDLENDFYIRYVPQDEGYLFASKILCDWWRRYYAF